MRDNVSEQSISVLRRSLPLGYGDMLDEIGGIKEKYCEMEVTAIGESILGRKIPMLKIGRGKRKVLYVGAHHGMEWISSILLLAFAEDLLDSAKHSTCIGGVNAGYLLDTASIYVIPMLNPDGVEYSVNGMDAENPLRARVLKMNGGSEDLSRWQANARGVDLNHNYNAGFAEYKLIEREMGIIDGGPTRYSGQSPESEPEVAAVCSLIRAVDFSLLFALHSQGEEIFYKYGGDPTRTAYNMRAAQKIADMCGYSLSTPKGAAAYGGLSDWAGEVMEVPSFTFECGKGENPLPATESREIYSRIRRALFSAPMMF